MSHTETQPSASNLSEPQRELLQDIVDLHHDGRVMIHLNMPPDEIASLQHLITSELITVHGTAIPGVWTVLPTPQALGRELEPA